jgi:hypothetical protein
LRELAESIKVQGVMQPVLVRPVGDGYEIIAGERRVRAAAIAGLHEVPVIIKQVPDNAALAMALIENIQREDLNPLEDAWRAAPDTRISLYARTGRAGNRPLAQRHLQFIAAYESCGAGAADGAGWKVGHGARTRTARIKRCTADSTG